MYKKVKIKIIWSMIDDKIKIQRMGFLAELKVIPPISVVHQFGCIQPIPLTMDFFPIFTNNNFNKSKSSFAI